MKTKLFTQNIYLGLLMTLALAFSVQGIADALTFGTSRSGDLVTVSENQTFTIRFSVGLTSSRLRSGYLSIPSAQRPDTGERYYTDTDNSGDYTATEEVTDSEAFHYNDEAIAINTAGLTLMRSGTTITSSSAITRGGTASLSEGETDRNLQLSSSITLTGSHAIAGEYNIVITDVTADADFPTAPTGSPASITFTIFVVDDRNTGAAEAGWNFTGLTDGYKNGGTDFSDEAITVTESTDFVRVEYTVVEGPGRVYVQKDTRKSSTARTLSTSSAAVVHLDMNGGTNKVRASIAGVAPETGLFIFGYPNVAITGGNNQKGVASGRLEEALVVKVTDGKNRPISGLAAVFSIPEEPANTDAMFIPVTGTTVYTEENSGRTFADGYSMYTRVATPTRPAPPDGDTDHDIPVQTDSRGEAKTYFKLGTLTDQAVEVTAGGATPITPSMFTFEIGSTSRRPTLSILSGNNQRTDEHGELTDPLVVVVRQDGHLLPNQLVTFRATRGTLVGDREYTSGPPLATMTSGNAKRVYDITNSSGEAQVTYFQDPGEGSDTVRATIGVEDYEDTDFQRRVVFNINGGSSDQNQNQNRQPTNTITLTLSDTTGAPGDEIDVRVTSDPSDREVTLNSGDLDDDDFSRLSGFTPFTSTLTLPDEADTYTFSATRSGFTRDSATVRVTTGADETGARLAIEITGTGTTRTVTVTATNAQRGNVPGLDVTLHGSALVGGARLVRVGTPTNITVRTGTLEAAATGFATAREPITVTGGGNGGGTPQDPSTPGTLTVQKDGAQVGTQQTLLVTASPAPSSNVDFTVTRGGLTVGSGTILTTGSGRGIATVPTTGLYVLTVSATGYTPKQVTFTAGEQPLPRDEADETDEAPPTAGEPSRLSVIGLSTHSGTVNEPLDQQLSVQVLDANGIGVENVRVVFRVRTGQGRLSTRGNGRAIAIATDSGGYARADYTPLSESSTVSANANGVAVGVTFTITTGSTPPPETTPRTGDTTPTPPPTVRPVVNAQVGVASRPPMLWISGGKIYALVGSEVKTFAQGVENAMSLAIGGGKVYWTEKTGETRGTLKSANLDGTDAKLLRNEPLWGVPVGIAVDVAGSKLYWVDAANRLQRSDLNGSNIQNVLRNLSDPKDLALANGNAYWTQGNGHVRFVNLTGQPRSVRNISTGTDPAGSLAIAGGKVYWTEQIDGTYGTLNAANLDGTGATQLRDDALWGAPVGIAVDTARSRLYWTDGAGRLQRSNLDASGIHNVVKGLGMPGDMVLSNSITVPAETPSTTPTTTTPTTASKYDLNGDGSVNDDDENELLIALAAGSTNAKYDIDDDGTVNIFDLIDLRGQIRDAAGAPTLLGMKFSAVEVERLQEQIDLLVASSDRSPEALKTLIYLQQLIVMARPEKTQLLANYPNPFNPETWIPYELATDTDVRITIYNAQGVVIRTLQLGQQSAGYYTDRQRAAYWDGRNALGEQVASGVYFYQFETDTLSTLRKMVILK